MDIVKQNPGMYVAYDESIPEYYKEKFKLIHRPGGTSGHLSVDTIYYREKTVQELEADRFLVSQIPAETMVATFGDMRYHDRLPKSLHKYFDYTLETSSLKPKQMRVNVALYDARYDAVPADVPLYRHHRWTLGDWWIDGKRCKKGDLHKVNIVRNSIVVST